jgi:hypothetical protein
MGARRRREAVEASTGPMIGDPLLPRGADPQVSGGARRSTMPSPWSWLAPAPWECPRCLTVIVTNVAAPRCPRCLFVEGT